jgi:hypothetical protein
MLRENMTFSIGIQRKIIVNKNIPLKHFIIYIAFNSTIGKPPVLLVRLPRLGLQIPYI